MLSSSSYLRWLLCHLPNPVRSGNPGCAPTATLYFFASLTAVLDGIKQEEENEQTDSIVSLAGRKLAHSLLCNVTGSDAWNPQATLATSMCFMISSSGPSCHRPNASPMSELICTADSTHQHQHLPSTPQASRTLIKTYLDLSWKASDRHLVVHTVCYRFVEDDRRGKSSKTGRKSARDGAEFSV